MLCSMSELLPSVAAHFRVLCHIYSIVFQHTAVFCQVHMNDSSKSVNHDPAVILKTVSESQRS